MQKDMEAKAEKGTVQQPEIARGTQAFRNFTERTNNNYIEKILSFYGNLVCCVLFFDRLS